MKKIAVFLVLGILTTSCNEKFDYKYKDKAQVVSCPGADNALLNEALFSFENDIASFYNQDNYPLGSPMFFEFGYANYMYTGATAEADFKNMVSPYTLQILEKLKKEKQLWEKSSKETTLNYKSEFVQCLIENIKNQEIKQKIQTLLDVDYLNPAFMAEFYRVNSVDALDDKYFALFIALETYYPRLMKIEFTALETVE
ncbi:hypothetical protein ATE92_1976 [Ulvibacter sp. MAR_2010_11]|uniref:hypothetical protein n=1 Tax=Ulvibacter sp. MAR_2010_11 TaxID=1250229 RepID=UPI000CC323F4|nr:hypothetical protein [Ulvibacter sp. MAR_2010_11]PKA83810.1 hypothetical protein ATE92_1976 [Ulvibacter sp. MAR_2010_11]